MNELSERESLILQSVVRSYIMQGQPVGSRVISHKFALGISPATVRNTMFDLEEMGFVKQPHTSAGRVPTDKGYRYYVDSLMVSEQLTEAEKRDIEKKLKAGLTDRDADDILDQMSRVLAEISEQLGVAMAPHFEEGVFQKLEMISLTEKKVLLVLTIKSALVKTVIMEVTSYVTPKKLAETNHVLNERLSGLSIAEIRRSLPERIKGVSKGDPKLLKFFAEEVEQIFRFDSFDDLHVGGTTNIVSQPEFSDKESLAQLMRFIEERKSIIYLLEHRINKKGAVVTIGSENPPQPIQSCSLVTATYTLGDMTGTIGIIGPTRMKYWKLISLVDYAAKLTSELLSQ